MLKLGTLWIELWQSSDIVLWLLTSAIVGNLLIFFVFASGRRLERRLSAGQMDGFLKIMTVYLLICMPLLTMVILYRETFVYIGPTEWSDATRVMHVFHNSSLSYFTPYGNHWSFVALLVIWLSGFLFCGLQQYIKDRSVLRRLRAASSLCEDQRLLDLQRIFEKELGIRRPVRIWQSDLVDVPFAAGICRQEIWFPRVSLDEGELCLMLQHELIHCKRRDPLYRRMIFWLGSLYWFVPFPVRLAAYYTEINEMSCDDRVLKQRTKQERLLYARTLAELAQRESFLQNAVSLTGHTKSQLENRLEHMLQKKREAGRWAAMAMTVLFVGVCPLTTLAACAGMSKLQDVVTEEVFMEDHEEVMVIGNVLEEETDVIEDLEMMPLEVYRLSLGCEIDHDISTASSLGMITVSAGMKIHIFLIERSAALSFRAGYIDSTGKRTYVTTFNEEINHSFTITEDGTYELFIEPAEAGTIHLSGMAVWMD